VAAVTRAAAGSTAAASVAEVARLLARTFWTTNVSKEQHGQDQQGPRLPSDPPRDWPADLAAGERLVVLHGSASPPSLTY